LKISKEHADIVNIRYLLANLSVDNWKKNSRRNVFQTVIWRMDT
jgi:hypothetical protein